MNVGIDILKNDRIKDILDKNRDGFYRRIFSDIEIEYISMKNHDYRSVAGLFAAKEAVSKLLGTGIGQIGWKDIEILHNDRNKPYVSINKKLKSKLYDIDNDSIELSISHENEFSIAFAVGYKQGVYENYIPKDIRSILPKRELNSHKGTFGKVGIIAGSKGMTGAPYLSSMAALRSGSGIVYSIVPEEIADVMSMKSVELIVKGYNDILELKEFISKLDGLVVGPGLGQNDDVRKLVKTILEIYNGPLVLDADGINSIDDYNVLNNREGVTIITPHPGELARLLSKDIKEIQDKRIYYSKYSSEKYNVITVLKGYETLVTHKDNSYKNMTGNSGMATAGSGDVLAGMIISFICQGIDPFEACKLATYAHGLAGDLAKIDKGEYGLIATDILNFIPEALKRIQQ